LGRMTPAARRRQMHLLRGHVVGMEIDSVGVVVDIVGQRLAGVSSRVAQVLWAIRILWAEEPGELGYKHVAPAELAVRGAARWWRTCENDAEKGDVGALQGTTGAAGLDVAGPPDPARHQGRVGVLEHVLGVAGNK